MIMATCAIIDNETGQLVNLIVADPSDESPVGTKLIEIPNGYYWDGEQVSLIPVILDGN